MHHSVKQSWAQKREMIADNIGDKCLGLDLYGRNVQFTFHGNEKFRTKFGAFCTLIVGLIVTAYALFSLTDLLDPKLPVPAHSKILYRSFYDIYAGVENVRERDASLTEIVGPVDQKVRPGKFFAFGLGWQLVRPNVGRFVVTGQSMMME